VNSRIEAIARLWRERNALLGPATEATEGIVAEILGDFDPIATCQHLDTLLRLRAVSGRAPAEALAFVFDLRALLAPTAADGPDDTARFALRVDQVALWAFDVYTRCREEIFRLRLKEVANRPPRPEGA
jgi:hypothetical protein